MAVMMMAVMVVVVVVELDGDPWGQGQGGVTGFKKALLKRRLT